MIGNAIRRLRARLRYFSLGLTTITGLARNGYFIPYRLASKLPLSASRASYPALEAMFAAQERSITDFAGRMSRYLPDLMRETGPGPAVPRLDQNWFPPLDALAAYTMIHEVRPRIILEIGGGHSTRIFVQAADSSGSDPSITVVDAQPRRALGQLARQRRIKLHNSPIQSLSPAELPPLGQNDILSLDGSHILMPGSDSDAVLNRLIPRLPPGVVLHFHDVFLPDPYPDEWAWRGYNEQQGIAALLAGGAARVMFSSHYLITRLPEQASRKDLASLPMSPAPASSLWLRWRG